MTAGFSRLPNLSFIGICVAAAVSLSSAVAARASESWHAGVDLIRRAVAFAFDVLARPLAFPPAFGRVALDGPALSYDGPPIHSLRHEAGVSRRSAARNV